MSGAAATAGTVTLGDLVVNRMGFGAMRITGKGIWGEPPDRAEAKRVLRRVVELGVEFIDTADSYGPAVSEELIAEALHPYPEGLIIATKGGFQRSGPGQWERDCRPEHLREACHDSLRRLRLEQIALYQLHNVDPNVPLEESLGALVELQREGKIRHIGVSNVDGDELRRAQAVATVVSVQDRYSVLERKNEAVLETCEREGLPFLPWGPVRPGDAPVTALLEVAAARGVPEQQVMLAWLLARSPAMLVIPGTGSVAHAEANIAAAGLQLASDELARLDRMYDEA